MQASQARRTEFWNLRSYLPKDHALKPLEIGSEKTPQEFIANLMAVYDQVYRVTREDGTAWVNLGDTYSSSGGHTNVEQGAARAGRRNQSVQQESGGIIPDGISAGNLVGIPFLFVQAMQSRGWVHRNTIVWHKPAPMPASLDGWRWERCRIKTKAQPRGEKQKYAQMDGRRDNSGRITNAIKADYADCPGCEKCRSNDGLILRKGSWRCTNSWEYIFMFSKGMNYFCDSYAVRQPASQATISRNQYSRILDDDGEQFAVAHDHEFSGITANLRNVWTIGPEPLAREQHYAAFPSEIPRRIISAATSAKGCCSKCGTPWARIVSKTPAGSWSTIEHREERGQVGQKINYDTGSYPPAIIEGWRACCDCKADVVPCRVLDPFGGSGRSATAAIELGRDCILCELNPEYIEMQSRQNHGVQIGMFG